MTLEELIIIIGDNIRFYRINNIRYGYLTQEELSRKSGVSLSLIRKIEAKDKIMVINIIPLINIANSLNIPIYKLFTRNRC